MMLMLSMIYVIVNWSPRTRLVCGDVNSTHHNYGILLDLPPLYLIITLLSANKNKLKMIAVFVTVIVQPQQ